MLVALVLLAIQVAPENVPSTVVGLPCAAVRARAGDYFEEHTFWLRDTDGQSRPLTDFAKDLIVEVGTQKGPSTPQAHPLGLDRFSIGRYVLPKRRDPMRAYDFDVKGQLTLHSIDPTSCQLRLRFEVSAFSYVWALGMIDDGETIAFQSNGVLERMYLDGLAADLSSRVQKAPVPP